MDKKYPCCECGVPMSEGEQYAMLTGIEMARPEMPGGMYCIGSFCPPCFKKLRERYAHKPKPEPKPMKLEAGARVEDSAGDCATVISVCRDEVCVLYEKEYGLMCFSKDALTITEAATPEVGDMVQTGDGATGIILEVRDHDDGYLWAYVYSTTNKCWRHFRRDDFTILHKAPKEDT